MDSNTIRQNLSKKNVRVSSPVSPIHRYPEGRMTDFLSPKGTDVFDLVSILSQNRTTREGGSIKAYSLNTFEQEVSCRMPKPNTDDLRGIKKALSEADFDSNHRCRLGKYSGKNSGQHGGDMNNNASENDRMFSSKERGHSQKLRREEMKELLNFCRDSKKEETKKDNIGMFETFSMKKFKEFMSNKRL